MKKISLFSNWPTSLVTHWSSEKLRSRASNKKLFSCWYGQAIQLKVHWRLNYVKRKLKIQAMMCWFWNTRFDLILKVSIFMCDWNTWTWFGSIVFKSIPAHSRSSDYSTERKLYSGRGLNWCLNPCSLIGDRISLMNFCLINRVFNFGFFRKPPQDSISTNDRKTSLGIFIARNENRDWIWLHANFCKYSCCHDCRHGWQSCN